MRSDRDREAEEAGERGLRRAAPVEPEHELVEVGLEVLLAQAVVDAQGPPLRVREHPMHPGQDQVGRRVADHLRVVLDLLQLPVARPAVAHHRAAVRDVAGDECAQALGRVVADHRQPGPPRALALDLDRARDQELAVVRPPGPGRLAVGAKGQAGLVHLDQAGQRLPVRVDHRRPQLPRQQPGRLVAAQAQLQPELPGRHPVLVRRHQPGGGEPDPQRQVAAVHHRASGHRGLAPAGPALQGQDLAPEPPEAVVAAARAGEAPAPAVLQQPLGAGRLVREPALELRQRPGKTRHGAIPPIPLQDWIAWWAQRDKPFPQYCRVPRTSRQDGSASYDDVRTASTLGRRTARLLDLAGRIVTPHGIRAGRLRFAERIASVEPTDAAGADTIIMPGFVDLHVHGGGGADTMRGEADVRRLVRFHGGHGTTALLPTTVTAPDADLLAAAEGVAAVMARPEPGGAAVLGLHLEGPFISPKRLGAQPPFARPPDLALFEALNARVPVRVTTWAPEEDASLAFLRAATAAGCRCQIGHSDASCEQVLEALAAGAAGFTHLFNAMRPFQPRDPGVAGAALLAAARAELIPDLLHVAPAAIRLALRLVPDLYAITDAMEAAGCPDGLYRLGTRG